MRHFFSVLPTGDCQVLAPLLATGGSARPCVETVRELRAHGLGLVGIVGSSVDGRDAEAVIVRARVAHGGRERPAPWLLRVERQRGAWRVRF
ncbi:putative lipoprotein [Myxococcus hansupus]|uniref:Putative lipoprotein n=1 Tax=Pseudomyxococcus hansupus TaxID=1297742 RepID=A0A0H4X4C6_9BACT|nr:putative lipoprotein [Myxococcus hansupus]